VEISVCTTFSFCLEWMLLFIYGQSVRNAQVTLNVLHNSRQLPCCCECVTSTWTARGWLYVCF